MKRLDVSVDVTVTIPDESVLPPNYEELIKNYRLIQKKELQLFIENLMDEYVQKKEDRKHLRVIK